MHCGAYRQVTQSITSQNLETDLSLPLDCIINLSLNTPFHVAIR